MGYHRRMAFIYSDIIAIKSKLSAHRERGDKMKGKLLSIAKIRRSLHLHFLTKDLRVMHINVKFDLKFLFS